MTEIAGGLNVLLGVHKSGINIEVRVDLDGRDVEQKSVYSGAKKGSNVGSHIFKPMVLSSRPVEEATTRPSEQKARQVASRKIPRRTYNAFSHAANDTCRRSGSVFLDGKSVNTYLRKQARIS